MKLNAYAILDTKVGSYSAPFFTPTTGGAVRLFSDLASDPQSTLHKHPDDFRLFHVGTFEVEKGQLEGAEPSFIMSATEFFKPPSSAEEVQ